MNEWSNNILFIFRLDTVTQNLKVDFMLDYLGISVTSKDLELV